VGKKKRGKYNSERSSGNGGGYAFNEQASKYKLNISLSHLSSCFFRTHVKRARGRREEGRKGESDDKDENNNQT
jgi:hypothetical protein